MSCACFIKTTKRERAADYIDGILSANVRSAFVEGRVELWHYYKRAIFNLVCSRCKPDRVSQLYTVTISIKNGSCP